jgi:hypothetical protein
MGHRLYAATGSRDPYPIAPSHPHTTAELLALLDVLTAAKRYDVSELRGYLLTKATQTHSFAEWCLLRRALFGELGVIPKRFIAPPIEEEPETLEMRTPGAYELRRHDVGGAGVDP